MDISWKFTEWNSGAFILYSSYETIHTRGAKYSWTDFFSIIWLDATLNIPARNDARNYLGKARHELEKSNKTLHTVPVTVTIFSHPFFHHLKKRRHVFGQNNLIIKKKSSLHLTNCVTLHKALQFHLEFINKLKYPQLDRSLLHSKYCTLIWEKKKPKPMLPLYS